MTKRRRSCAIIYGRQECLPLWRSRRVDNQAFMEQMQQIANLVLVWIGFGTLVGLLAKAIMPGRDPGGAVATLAMGVAGTIIGCAGLMYFTNGQRVSPICPLEVAGVW